MPGEYQPLVAIICVSITLAALVRGRMASDVAMAGGIALLVLTGILTPGEAFAGLSSPSIITIALLLVVSQGVIETGVVQWLGGALLGRGTGVTAAQLRLMVPVAGVSAFINNTPLVAMCIPLVEDFARRTRIPPGKLFIPLAFAASLGGVCTLIGTSTNLVVHEMWLKGGGEPFHLFDLAPIGVPVALCGIAYIVIAGRWLLPDSGREALATADPRSYSVEMQVVGPAVAGKSVEAASLRGLEGLYLSEIRRGEEIIAPVEPTTMLAMGDTLIFIGDVRSVVSLQKMRGLAAAADQTKKLAQARHQRFLVEAVVSDSSPLLNRTIREARFRNTYDAVVIAVSRNGARLTDVKLGSIELRAGDVLLLETQGSFLSAFGESRDFLLVRRIEDSAPVRHERAPVAAAILAAVIIVASFEPFGFTMLHAALAGACLMLATRCCTGPQARKALNVRLLFVIAGSLALGAALEKTGVAAKLAGGLLGVAAGNALLALAALYVATFILTELLSNATAAALVYPIAMSAAVSAGFDPKYAAIVVMIGASASFATPIGYQTNLMVQAPGGYRFADYMKIGIPLGILTGVVTLASVWILIQLEGTHA